MSELSVLEICAGAGGQSLGLELAGFHHAAAVEIDRDACATLRLNRPHWNVLGPDGKGDVRETPGSDFTDVDLLAGGVPCPPFSIAGKQLGADDERDLFPEAVRLAREIRPAAVMLENVRGLASSRFSEYRRSLLEAIEGLGYLADWKLLQASDFGVPQLRPRFILVALRPQYFRHFEWPHEKIVPPTVGEELVDLMAADGWEGAHAWAGKANDIAPTIVGGSKKHGGADLGPTRAKRAWRTLGVDGMGIADAPPSAADPYDHIPRLTVPMVARVQGWSPDHEWRFSGRKTSAYRQVGNAFPPPVAAAVGSAVKRALSGQGQRHALLVQPEVADLAG